MLHKFNLASLHLHICIIIFVVVLNIKQAQRINTVHKEADGGSSRQELLLFNTSEEDWEFRAEI